MQTTQLIPSDDIHNNNFITLQHRQTRTNKRLSANNINKIYYYKHVIIMYSTSIYNSVYLQTITSLTELTVIVILEDGEQLHH